MKQFYMAACIALLGFAACKEDVDYSEIDLGYDYYPNVVGSYIEYEVDSIHYGIEIDTTEFFLREVIAEDFIDDGGNQAYRIERYKKFSQDAEYQLTDVWVQLRTPTTGERVEENQRYVRLVFPVKAGETWDGNAYNTLDEWQYRYASIDQPYTLSPLQFGRTLRVNQRNNVNLVDQEVAWEVYARGVGMIQKKLIDLEFQNNEITGIDLEMKAIAYGTIE